MPKRTFVSGLLSLFTPLDRAMSIEGDLIEQSALRGYRWFVINLVSTAFALFNASIMRAPLKNLMLCIFGIGFSMSLGQIFCHFDLFNREHIWNYFLMPMAAASVGAILVKISPRAGINSAIVTAIFLFMANFLIDTNKVSSDIAVSVQQHEIYVFLKLIYGIVSDSVFALTVFIGPLLIGGIMEHKRKEN